MNRYARLDPLVPVEPAWLLVGLVVLLAGLLVAVVLEARRDDEEEW